MRELLQRVLVEQLGGAVERHAAGVRGRTFCTSSARMGAASLPKLFRTKGSTAVPSRCKSLSRQPGRSRVRIFPEERLIRSAVAKSRREGAGVPNSVIEMDHHVGEILDTLKRLQVEENTIFIFTSDNGPDDLIPWRGSAGPWSGSSGTSTLQFARRPEGTARSCDGRRQLGVASTLQNRR